MHIFSFKDFLETQSVAIVPRETEVEFSLDLLQYQNSGPF